MNTSQHAKQDKPEKWWNSLGPGLITGAADDDPSGIATYSQAGAQFGYAIGWTLLLTYPLMVGIQLASARIGRVTGEGLGENFSKLFKARWIVVLLISLLVIANVINLGADLGAMGDVAAMVAGGSKTLWTLAFGSLSLVLQIFIPYRSYVAVLKWLTLSLLAYVGVVFAVDIDWLAVLHGVLMPSLNWSKDYVTSIVAICGTTISPYLFFWQASQEVEEINRVGRDKPLLLAPGQARRQLRRLKIDTWAGMGFSNLIALFMIIATAATLNAHGITHIETAAQAAAALEPVAGKSAYFLFALGIIGTGMLALPVLAGSAAYAVAAQFGWSRSLDLAPGKAGPFYAIITAAMIIGTAISLAHVNPMRALYWAAVINAVISVPIMVSVMLVVSSHRLMGKLVMDFKWRVLGWGATVAMAIATVAMFVSMLM
ncbi:MAG: iron transporter [Rhodocyclales bacterium]|nr:iron transporter [Rhodocyclales bacterium]